MGRQRRALTGVLVAVFLAAGLSSCTQPGWPGGARRTTTTRSTPPTTSSPVTGRYVEKQFENVDQIATGVTFKAGAARANGDKVDLKFDAWAPAGDTVTKRPAIVWMFGGAFIAGNRQTMNTFAQDSARRGYVGITIDYRLEASATPITNLLRGIYNAYDDSLAAADFLKANAAQYGIDPDALIAGGFSAGAITAVNDIVLPGSRGPATSPYAAAISNSGSSAMAMVCSVISSGSSTCQTESKAGQGPMILFGGDQDKIVNYKWQKITCDNHRAKGNVCEFVTYPGESHGVISKIPDLLNRSAAFVKREALAAKGYD
jgi:acetyl esterase/lipase